MKIQTLALSAALGLCMLSQAALATGSSSSSRVTGPGFAAANQASTAQAFSCGNFVDGDYSQLSKGSHGVVWSGGGVDNDPDTWVGFEVKAHNIGTASFTTTSSGDSFPFLVGYITATPADDNLVYFAGFLNGGLRGPKIDRWNVTASSILSQLNEVNDLQPGSRLTQIVFYDGQHEHAWDIATSAIMVNNHAPSIVSGIEDGCDLLPF